VREHTGPPLFCVIFQAQAAHVQLEKMVKNKFRLMFKFFIISYLAIFNSF
jgi:hypothetical protein